MDFEKKPHVQQGHDEQQSTALSRDQRAQSSLWKDLLAGGVAGTAGIVIGHPFDTIKVRLQQQHQLQQQSNPKIQAVVSKGSPSTYRGLFLGIGAPLATAAIVNASVFCMYGATSRLWDSYFPESITREYFGMDKDTIVKQTICGAVTGLTTSLVLSPVEYVKIRLQTMKVRPREGSASLSFTGTSSNSSFQLAKEIMFSRHGLKGLYRGFVATILRQTPSLGLYFPVYHMLNESITDFYTCRSDDESTITNTESLWWSSAMAGGLAGCLSWTIVYPIDAVKSRIQSMPLETPAKERSIIHIARRISQNEGFVKLTLSRGLAVTLLRAFPVNGTIFFVYEAVSQRLREYDNDNLETKKFLIETSVTSAHTETQMRTIKRRKISFRVDETVAVVSDVS